MSAVFKNSDGNFDDSCQRTNSSRVTKKYHEERKCANCKNKPIPKQDNRNHFFAIGADYVFNRYVARLMTYSKIAVYNLNF